MKGEGLFSKQNSWLSFLMADFSHLHRIPTGPSEVSKYFVLNWSNNSFMKLSEIFKKSIGVIKSIFPSSL